MKHALLIVLACLVCSGADKLLVITGISAQNEAVNEIGAGLVQVQSLLPPGASPETYSPKARQLALCSKARIFLSINTPMEKAVLHKIKASFPQIKICDTTEGMLFREIDAEEGHHHRHGGHDPHVWLGIHNMKIHARNVAKALSGEYPEKAKEINANLIAYLSKLDLLEKHINEILMPLSGETILVFHPAFGYLLDAANIKQVAVEQHGKDASAMHLAELSKKARSLKCSKLFVQPQSNPVSAEKAASILGKACCQLSPIPENYSIDMLELANSIRSAFPQ